MCAHCGCSETLHEPGDGHDHERGDARLRGHEHDHDHDHEHRRSHEHAQEDGAPARTAASRRIRLEHDLLARNEGIAARNRAWLRERAILAVNLVASPGAGKTTLLERTVAELGSDVPIHVVEADPATDRDAARLRAVGCRVVQVNTGAGCHLDAEMVRRALEGLRPDEGSIVFLENVGNLVCPALFDLGEGARVVVASLPEGEDKPIKYPHIFRSSDVMLLNKIDLLPHLPFDLDACARFASEVNPGLLVLTLSAARGDGMSSWYDWLERARRSAATAAAGARVHP